MLTGRSLGFIGGGNMAEAIIRGLLAGGVSAADIVVAEPIAGRREFLRERYGVSVSADNAAAAGADVIILAVKPQVHQAVLAGLGAATLTGKLLISIMAGVTAHTIENAAGAPVRVVRVMPNTPALVLAGASALSKGATASDEDLDLTRQMFDLIGSTCVVDEMLMDAVTGLSGSGPAYVFAFIEALSDAGVKNGLPRETASRLAAQTVFGAAKLVLESSEHPAVLREKVTSPGGTTIAGLASLERDGFRGALINAVDAATARSAELGKR